MVSFLVVGGSEVGFKYVGGGLIGCRLGKVRLGYVILDLKLMKENIWCRITGFGAIDTIFGTVKNGSYLINALLQFPHSMSSEKGGFYSLTAFFNC